MENSIITVIVCTDRLKQLLSYIEFIKEKEISRIELGFITDVLQSTINQLDRVIDFTTPNAMIEELYTKLMVAGLDDEKSYREGAD
jgi:dihydrodipicolinate reductase